MGDVPVLLTVKRFIHRPGAPYAFTPHLERFTLPGAPTPALYDAGLKRCRVLLPLPGGGWAAVETRFHGEPLDPLLVVRVWSPDPGLAAEAFRLQLERLRVGFDYNRFLEAVEPWPGLRRLAERYLGLRPGRALGLYEALVDAVVKQRIALRAALRVQSRLVQRYGMQALVRGDMFCSGPLPERLAGASVEELRSLGLTRLKAEALREIARAELEARLPSVEEAEWDPWSVAGELTRLRGVGRWTVELATAMVHPLFPVGPSSDLAVRRGLSRLLGESDAAVERILRSRELRDYIGLVMYLAAYSYEDDKRRGRRGGAAP